MYDPVTDPINYRWYNGIDHDPRSKEIYEAISKVDFEFGDYFCFKHGGDGDNGEHFMYLLDIHFERLDKAQKVPPSSPKERFFKNREKSFFSLEQLTKMEKELKKIKPDEKK